MKKIVLMNNGMAHFWQKKMVVFEDSAEAGGYEWKKILIALSNVKTSALHE